MQHLQSPHPPYRVAFFLILALLLGIAVALPFALGSVIDELVQPPGGDVFRLPLAPGVPAALTHSQLHVSVVDLDEARLLAPLRVSSHHVCRIPCHDTDRVVLFSYGTNEVATAGMPPSAKIDLATTERVVTATITLPVRGYPSRYPFDTYELWLGVGWPACRRMARSSRPHAGRGGRPPADDAAGAALAREHARARARRPESGPGSR